MRHFFVAFIVISLVLIFRLPDLTHKLSFDESVHAYIGSVALFDQRLPYLDVFDQKPPLVYLPYYLTELITVGNVISLRLFGIAYSFVVCLLLFMTLARYYSYLAGFFAVIIWLFWSTRYSVDGPYNLLSEFQLFLPLVLLLRWWMSRENKAIYYLLGGLLIAWASLLKQTYIFLIIVPILQMCLRDNSGRIRSFVWTLVGVFAPWILICLPYVFKGEFFWFYFGIFGYNQQFYITGTKPELFDWLSLFIGRIKSLDGLWPRASLILLMLALPWSLKQKKVFIFIAIIILLAVFSIWSGGSRMFNHYFLLVLFPLAMLSGIFIGRLAKTVKLDSYEKSISLVFILVVFVLMRNNLKNLELSNSTQFGQIADSKIGTLVKKSAPGDIAHLGSTNTYYFFFKSRLPWKNIILSELPFWSNHDFFMSQWREAVTTKTPQYLTINTTSELYTRAVFVEWLNQNYELLEEVSEIKIYKTIF